VKSERREPYAKLLSMKGLAVMIVSTVLLGCTTSRQANRPYHMSEAEWASAQNLLRSHPGGRLAVDSDSKNAPAIKRLRDSVPSFEPYFTAGAAHPENPDFALVLLKAGQFKVFYFRAIGSGYQAPQEVATVDWLNDGRVQLEGDTLNIAPFESDEIFRFGWDTTKKQLDLVSDSAQ
jgi:hypothetical protein